MLKKIVIALGAVLVLNASASALASDYLGNTKSMKYHYASCRTIKHPDAPHFVHFNSSDEARDAGYTPCRVCNPY